MNLFNLLGGPFKDAIDSKDVTWASGLEWLKSIAHFLDDLIIPVTIIVAVVGAIWIIILGVGLAKAESADKATEAKKRLINVAVALVSVLVLIWLLTFFAANAGTWFSDQPLTL